MIEIKKLTDKDVGRWVYYFDGFKPQVGRIKSWNDKYIFVVYHCDNKWEEFENYTAAATRPEDLFLNEIVRIIDTEPDVGKHTYLCSCEKCLKIKKVMFSEAPKKFKKKCKKTNSLLYQILINDGIWKGGD